MAPASRRARPWLGRETFTSGFSAHSRFHLSQENLAKIQGLAWPGRYPLRMGSAVRILVVEDTELIRAEVATILELEGFEVMEAENGRDGLRRLAEERPDLILSDVMMPEMDGFAFLEAARANTLWAGIPFVMLFARYDRAAVEHAMALGARRYLTKPVDVDALLATVSYALGDGRETSGE